VRLSARATPGRRGLGRQEGIALPIALSLLTFMLLLVGVAAGDGVFSVHRSVHDVKSKRAIQAADSGAKMATLRINTISLQGVLQSSIPCLGRAATGFKRVNVTVQLGNGWCPAVTEQAGNATSWSYQVSQAADLPPVSSCVTGIPCTITTTRTIVSKGTACRPQTAPCTEGATGSVTRRVKVTISGTTVVLRLITLRIQVTSFGRFQQTQYVECRAQAQAGQPPDEGC
jgi:hypothetical protein